MCDFYFSTLPTEKKLKVEHWDSLSMIIKGALALWQSSKSYHKVVFFFAFIWLSKNKYTT